MSGMTQGRDFSKVEIGDSITRLLGGCPMQLTVEFLDEELIYAGFPDPGDCWMFERKTGFEYDPRFNWGSQWDTTGSYLTDYQSRNPAPEGASPDPSPGEGAL